MILYLRVLSGQSLRSVVYPTSCGKYNHEGVYAGVADVSSKFKVRNSLRQGCTILFNIYFNAIMMTWCDHSENDGVTVL